MKKIIVLQGSPASGKSTWALEKHESNNNYVIVNRDSIRRGRGEYWIPEQEDFISEIEEFEVRSAIKNNLIPIIDATNLNPKTIEKWKYLAKELNCDIEFKEFKIDMKTALERDEKREFKVGRKVIEQFFMKYYPEEYKLYYTDPRIKEQELIGDELKNNLEYVIICDLDGTLCLHNGRMPYDMSENSILSDIPNLKLLKILRELNTIYKVIFTSGRKDSCRNSTEEWINQYFGTSKKGWKLLMRKSNDQRPDHEVKKEIYNTYIKNKYNIISIFDDRDQVVNMWRKLGLPCYQVYYGDF